MCSVTPIIVFHSLNVKRGGLTKAVMTRANTLVDYFDDVQLLTFFYQQKHKAVIQKLCAQGELDSRVKVTNFFVDIDPFKREKELDEGAVSPSIHEDGFVELEDTEAPNPSFWYYKDGLCMKYKRFNKDGKLIFVDDLNESGQCIQHEEYDEEGYLVRIRQIDQATDKPRMDRYMSYNGKCYLTVWLNPETEKEGRCHLFYPEPKAFESLQQLWSYWIDQKLMDIENPVLMSDSHQSDELLINIQSNKARRVSILHGNHLKSPYKKESKVRAFLEPLFSHLDQFDRIVFLTNAQKEDVSKQFGSLESYRVIPHAASQLVAAKTKEPEERFNPHLAITVARYEPQKKLEEAIAAFVRVVREIPDARYEIYGSGSHKDNLQELIDELGLQDHVKLMGYTQDPIRAYKKAACCLLTSHHEGFGMVLTESMAAGTPVVSYDIKYGPGDIIRDGVDGFLVPRGEQERLADQVIKMMKNPSLQKKMSKHAVEVVDRFSRQQYRESWASLVKELVSEDSLEVSSSPKKEVRFFRRIKELLK